MFQPYTDRQPDHLDDNVAQVENLTEKIAAMSEKELWSRRDQLDCELDRYGFMEGASDELDLIEDEIAARNNWNLIS